MRLNGGEKTEQRVLMSMVDPQCRQDPEAPAIIARDSRVYKEPQG